MKQVTIFIILFTCSIYSQQGWVRLQHPGNNFYQKIQFTDNNTGYVYSYDNGYTYLFKTTNLGDNWHDVIIPSNLYIVSFHFLNSNVGILSGRANYYAKFYKTTNGGNNWSLTFTGDSSLGSLYRHIKFIDAYTGYIGGTHNYPTYNIYKTTDAGSSWQRIPYTIPTIHNFSFINSTTGLILSSSATIFKTTNGGINWILKSSGLTDYLNDIFFINSQTGYVSGNNSLLMKTTNLGENWNIINFQVGPNNSLASIFFTSLDTGYHVRSYSQNIYKTTNGGYNWFTQNTTYTNDLIKIYFLNKDTGFAIGDTIILRTTNGGGPIGITPISTEIPNIYSLHQNYPNPFNPVTKIKFDLPKSGNVTVKIYDAIGMEITALVNEKLNAGVYSVVWNGVNYPSGIYFYQLTSGSYTETKKMVLVK